MLINGKTAVMGLFGDPVSHTLSPAMFNAAFRARGLNCCYLPFLVRRDALPAAVRAIAALGLKGVNVTAPHKEAVVPYLDDLAAEASLLQAVNTIKNEEGRLTGYNTDSDGFFYLLQKATGEASPLVARILLLGAGGAAGAVALALARAGAGSLIIANRTPARAEELAALLTQNGIFKPGKVETVELEQASLLRKVDAADLLVNALSTDPAAAGLLPRRVSWGCKRAVDLRYGTGRSPFSRWAGDNGMQAVDGLDMLLGQGARAFAIFTGEAPPLEVMQGALTGA